MPRWLTQKIRTRLGWQLCNRLQEVLREGLRHQRNGDPGQRHLQRRGRDRRRNHQGQHPVSLQARQPHGRRPQAGSRGRRTAPATKGNSPSNSTKIARPAYTIELNPGPNLISFPANPVDGDINAVFGGEGNEDITKILSYDNDSGLWMVADKGADGTFGGDLTTINGMNGYWVVADGIVDVSVVLEGGGGFSPPPNIQVQQGWNLIGVVDAEQSEAGTAIATRTTSPTSKQKWSTDTTP